MDEIDWSVNKKVDEDMHKSVSDYIAKMAERIDFEIMGQAFGVDEGSFTTEGANYQVTMDQLTDAWKKIRTDWGIPEQRRDAMLLHPATWDTVRKDPAFAASPEVETILGYPVIISPHVEQDELFLVSRPGSGLSSPDPMMPLGYKYRTVIKTKVVEPLVELLPARMLDAKWAYLILLFTLITITLLLSYWR